ncbi:MAG: mobile mystery protein A [Methylophaga sp.]|nr:mobile mystery protein A [Methylophaga sp.]
MSIKKIVQAQYQSIVDRAVNQSEDWAIPQEGWIRTVRKALGMSGSQLARRLGRTRAAVSNMERAELSGSVSIKNMQQMAKAMNCRFVYAIIPEVSIENLIQNRAKEKAITIVAKANSHMALEAQALDKERIEFEVNRIKNIFINDPSTDLWND